MDLLLLSLSLDILFEVKDCFSNMGAYLFRQLM